MKLQVFAEILGREVLVGFIEGASYREAVFQYTEDYLKSGSGAVSISLPLQEEAFSAMQTRNFFEGLLPEGFSRRAVSRWIKTEEEDYLTILSVLGQECIGALRLTEQGTEEPAGSYELLTSEQVRSLAEEGVSRSTRLLVESRLSLAGASGKVGLYFDRENGQWYLPKGKAPSTHIVKQSHVRLEKIVLNEQLCLMTARQMGLEVPDSFIINIGSGNDDEVLFASERYDRRQFSQKNINGLMVPYRLHQEDFGQALGISSGEKYEPSGGMYLRKMFSLLRDYAGNPIEDQRRLWDRIIFSRLIGNTDSHVKNFSLLYGPDLKTVSLAPVYDVVSTVIYDLTGKMSFAIGGEYELDKITRESFRAAARDVGLGVKMALERYDLMKEAFVPALKASAQELCDKGFPEARMICDRILDRTHIRT